MPNTILTPNMITREFGRILHQKLNFVTNCNTQYDNSFAKDGAKIGDTLRVRLPNEYTVRTGMTMSAQDTAEQSINLTVSTVKGVDMEFTSTELALSLNDFSKRIIEPAAARLAAAVEADALSMALDVNGVVNNIGSAFAYNTLVDAEKLLTDDLAPMDNSRYLLLNTTDHASFLKDTKGLFQAADNIKEQYKSGQIGTTGGFDVFRNTLIPNTTTGTAAATTGYLVNGAGQSGSSLVVDTGTTTFKKGDVITIANVFRVHPETKVSTSDLMQFVITADHGGGAGTLAIAPAIVTTGGRQNVSAGPADNAAVSKIGGASAVYRPSLAFHKDAFLFATADLPLPYDKKDDPAKVFASRMVYDGLSISLVRDFAISNRTFPCRIDILYGYATHRRELAKRILSN